jgi:hypothetical protein
MGQDRNDRVDIKGKHLHKSIIDGDDEDFARVFKLLVGNVVWDVGIGACWAYILISISDQMMQVQFEKSKTY